MMNVKKGQKVAWYQGYLAFSRAGIFRESNPFTVGTRNHEQWLDAFNTAEAARSIES